MFPGREEVALTAVGGRAAGTHTPASLRDDREHGAVRRDRPSRDEHSVWRIGRAADWSDADRQALGRVDDLPCRARLRAERLAPDVTGSADRDPEERPGCAAAFPSARRVGAIRGLT